MSSISNHSQSSSLEDEPLTEELLKRLLASTSPEAYLDREQIVACDFSQAITALAKEKGLSRATVLRRAHVAASYGYQVFDGERHPHRNVVIALSFGLQCSLVETQRLLKRAGYSELYCKDRRDAIIISCVNRRLEIDRCDDELYRLGEDTLLDENGYVRRSSAR